jgi:hypothetical protein
MYSSWKSSVKRHIQNIHGGNANFVSFIDYLVGIKSGYYWPSLPPTYQKKNVPDQSRLSAQHEAIASLSVSSGSLISSTIQSIVINTQEIKSIVATI